jgi:hypothetical protein
VQDVKAEVKVWGKRCVVWALALVAAGAAQALPRVSGEVQWILPAFKAEGSLDGPRDRALLHAVEGMIPLPNDELLVASTPPFGSLSLRKISADGTVSTIAPISPGRLRLTTPRAEADAVAKVFYVLAEGQLHQTLYAVSSDGALKPLVGPDEDEFGALERHERYSSYSGNTRDGFWFLNGTRGKVRHLTKGNPPIDVALDVDEPDWHATGVEEIAAGPDRSFWAASRNG